MDSQGESSRQSPSSQSSSSDTETSAWACRQALGSCSSEPDTDVNYDALFRRRTYRRGGREEDPEVPDNIRLKINMRERQRMHDLNTSLDSLRQVIPHAQGPNVKKVSKMTTLSLARNYIVALRRSLDDARQLLSETYRKQLLLPRQPLAPEVTSEAGRLSLSGGTVTSAPYLSGLPLTMPSPVPVTRERGKTSRVEDPLAALAHKRLGALHTEIPPAAIPMTSLEGQEAAAFALALSGAFTPVGDISKLHSHVLGSTYCPCPLCIRWHYTRAASRS